MRRRLLAVAMVLAAVMLTLQSERGLAQFRGGGPRGGFMADPDRLFGLLSRGRDHIVISEMRMFREPLEKWAQERGITNGQLTREQFAAFVPVWQEQMKNRSAPGGFGWRGPGGSPGGMVVNVSPSSSGGGTAEGASRWAEFDFSRRDRNGDGTLNLDEVPDSLRDDFRRWDNNRDNQIDRGEYTAYMGARIQERNRDNRSDALAPARVIIEDDLDRRPVVYRAGNLPKELPSWFEGLDTDTDGQVALYEWRKGRRPLNDFKVYDRNADGFLTAEEVLWREARAKEESGQSSNGPTAAAGGRFPTMVGSSGGGPRRFTLPGGSGEFRGRVREGGGPPPWFRGKKSR